MTLVCSGNLDVYTANVHRFRFSGASFTSMLNNSGDLGDTSTPWRVGYFGSVSLSQSAASGTPIPTLLVTGAAHTALTASTEYVDVNINLARTAQFATGALTTQRAVLVQAPTYSAVGASTMTVASTVYIDGPPTAGTNVTITNPYALKIGSGVLAVGTDTSGTNELRISGSNNGTQTFDARYGSSSGGFLFTLNGGSTNNVLIGAGAG